ncbi:MAG: hypothetical protein KAY24_00470, partial [Candidatus Eisenbacteria sp.]|nr:hypothetical protein [Candidatus Eisenbacteria bacterium]
MSGQVRSNSTGWGIQQSPLAATSVQSSAVVHSVVCASLLQHRLLSTQLNRGCALLRVLLLILLLCVVCLPLVHASARQQVGEAAYVDLPCGCAYLRTLTIRCGNIFPPEDPYAQLIFARWANALHVVTRESVIRRSLHFREGDLVCREDLEVTIRRLRTYAILHNNIELHVQVEGDSMDLTVATRDVWTTRPTFQFHKEGGLWTWSAGLQEFNLLGLGKGLGVAVGEDELQPYWGLWYQDPQFAQRDMYLFAGLQRGDDLESAQLKLGRRQDRAAVPWGLDLEATSYKGKFIDRRGGLDGPEWREDQWLVSISCGPRVAGAGRTALRLKPAIYFTSEQYDAPVDSTEASRFGAPLKPREIRAIGLEVDFLRERYSQRSGINAMHCREDFNLGTELRLLLGRSARSFGAAEDGLYLELKALQGVSMGPRRFLLGTIWGVGQIIDGCGRDVRIESALRYYHNLTDRQTLAMRLRAGFGVHLAPQDIFVMGSKHGLRGYEAYRFWGERVLQLNMEDRVILLSDLMGLVTVGLAAFVDGGLAWRAGHHEEARPRLGAGIGLRFLGSRTRGTVATRIDLGFPV